MRKLGINKDDHVLAITSAGDNVLHYALAAQCKRIHAVGAFLKLQVPGDWLKLFRHEPLSGAYP